ncbi:MAG: C39 family peptidase [Methylacidiphilales bacterium]|nr:C39 family peptidase [Candidatus Methylacidiphilales bacterium]
MPAIRPPLSTLSPVYHRRDSHTARMEITRSRRRLALWLGGALIAWVFYFDVPGFFAWKHVISSSGGRYFVHRVEIPVPPFEQDDPRWTFELLGPTFNTLGQQGCAVASAAMVLAAYGVDTDPQRLNQYLTTHAGYTPNGWVYWEKAAEVAPGGQVEKAYEDLPSYALIDENLARGNPVIVRLTLRDGTTHFVVVVGKQGWDYLIRDPARSPAWGVYPLKNLTGRIEALRFFRVVPPHPVNILANSAPTPGLQNP